MEQPEKKQKPKADGAPVSSAQQHLLSPNSVCVALSSCNLGATFEVQAPTATSDRACANCTQCTDLNAYEVNACFLTRDTVCEELTMCGESGFELIAPTPTTDR